MGEPIDGQRKVKDAYAKKGFKPLTHKWLKVLTQIRPLNPHIQPQPM